MSETMGRCRSEVDSYRKPEFHYAAIADAIDRLAADVAAVKAKVDAVSPEDVRHFVESEKAWVALVTEQRDAAITRRDDAEAEVERLRAQLRFTLGRMRRLGYSTVAEAIESILSRAGSPPVVVLPTVFQHSSIGDKLVALQQVKDALDKAGVAWKAVPRE